MFPSNPRLYYVAYSNQSTHKHDRILYGTPAGQRSLVELFVCVPRTACVLRSHPACRYCLGVAVPRDVTREMQSRVTEAPAASRKPARGAAISADAAFLQIPILPPVRTWRIPALPTNNATSVFGICLSGYQQQSPLFGSGNDLCSVRVEMAQCRVCAPWPELELGSEHQSFGPPQTSTIGVRA